MTSPSLPPSLSLPPPLSLSLPLFLILDYSITSVVVNRSVGSGPVNANTTDMFAFTCVVNYMCTGTCNQTQSLTITWTLNGMAITNSLFASDDITMEDNILGNGISSDTLTSMGNVRVSHAGMYSCTATLGQGSSSGNNETLTVLGEFSVV